MCKVLQLAHVARPLVVDEHLFGLFGKDHLAVVLVGVEFKEHARQGEDVGLTLAQGRNGNDRHLEPVVEITAEFAPGDGPFQIFVGGGDDAHVDLFGCGGPHAHDLPILQKAQQPRLHGHGQFAYLVQKERPPGGRFDEADLPGLAAAGKSARRVAEELGFNEVFRDAPAVNLDEGPVLARAQGMDAPGDDVLAHARLAQKQDRSVGFGNGVHLAVELEHGVAGENLGRLA